MAVLLALSLTQACREREGQSVEEKIGEEGGVR